jgi:hypothetical protein
MMADVCVVHLVRAQNGIEPFRRFIASYTQYRAGIEHDLLVIFKGFVRDEDTWEYRQLMSCIQYKTLFVRDFGYDIRAYFAAVKKYNYDYYVFLNSFSRIMDNEWLEKMHTHIIHPNVGLVGASGSYESQYSNYVSGQQADMHTPWYSDMATRLKQWKKRIRRKTAFDPFPNYHIRTNGFMVSRDVMRRIRSRFIFNKRDAYIFESGKNSLSKQIMKMNLTLLVVGKDGRKYEKDEWCESQTFRQGVQSNLLIADNQTDFYMFSDPGMRADLTKRSWGSMRSQQGREP